jgi:hypothetical protein
MWWREVEDVKDVFGSITINDSFYSIGGAAPKGGSSIQLGQGADAA